MPRREDLNVNDGLNAVIDVVGVDFPRVNFFADMMDSFSDVLMNYSLNMISRGVNAGAELKSLAKL